MSLTSFNESSDVAVKLGKVLSYPNQTEDGKFICTIMDLMTTLSWPAIINPSPYGWVMPDEGAMVVFLDYPRTKRIISVIHDVEQKRPLSLMPFGSEELPRNIKGMAAGDAYIGKYARAYFGKDAQIFTDAVSARIHLDDDLGLAEVIGHNFDIYTEDGGIKIHTTGVTGMYGDSIFIDKTLPLATSPITSMSIGSLGNFSLQCGLLAGTASGSVDVSIAGAIKVKNLASSLEFLSTGSAELFATKVAMTSSTSFDLTTTAGGITMTSGAGIDVNATAGVTIDAGTTINLNSGTMGVARLGDEVMSLAATDTTFWTAWSTVAASLIAANSFFAADPSPLAKAMYTALSAFFSPTTVSITSKVTKASATVKAG